MAACLAGCANAAVNDRPSLADASTKDGAGGDTGSGAKKDGASADNGPSGPCDPFTNSGCPSGKKCAAVLNGDSLALGCWERGDKSEGNDCSATSSNDQPTGDDCGDALSCFQLKDESSPKCHRICPMSGTAHACSTGSICRITLPGITGYAFCGSSCKPLEQSGCADSEACYLTSRGAFCTSVPSNPVAVGQGCTGGNNVNECERGSTCVTGLSGGNKCLAFCSTAGGSPSCSSGTCTKVPVDDVFMSEPNVGTCR